MAGEEGAAVASPLLIATSADQKSKLAVAAARDHLSTRRCDALLPSPRRPSSPAPSPASLSSATYSRGGCVGAPLGGGALGVVSAVGRASLLRRALGSAVLEEGGGRSLDSAESVIARDWKKPTRYSNSPTTSFSTSDPDVLVAVLLFHWPRTGTANDRAYTLAPPLIEPPPYIYIETNDFSYRRHKRQKEEDIAVCECRYDLMDPDSACGERCWNVSTNTECTPGYCPCGVYCKNQRFQKCQYARTRLVKTEGRGWGLLADENITSGQFVIEYCGEVISSKVAKRRSQAYEDQGLMEAYIIYLNADESIDATKKGSLARFINHSCQPNCETRKWTVLGEVRVGIFAKQDIPIGTELSYNYNFEWFGGAMVRCLCGAASCSGFLGAKSRGFQEATYLWEDDDDRFSVENIPLYDSADDEPTSIPMDILLTNDEPTTQESNSNAVQSNENPEIASSNGFTPMTVEPLTACSDELTPVEPLTGRSDELTPVTIEPLRAIPMGDFSENGSTEFGAQYADGTLQNSTHKIAKLENQSSPQNNNHHTELVPVRPKPKFRGGKAKRGLRKQLNVADICDRLASAVAHEEILYCEEVKKQTAAEIDALYDEIRPAIEEHERDGQDNVPTSLAEQWIEASCSKYKAEFDLSAAIIRNMASTPLRAKEDVIPREQNGVLYLQNGSS